MDRGNAGSFANVAAEDRSDALLLPLTPGTAQGEGTLARTRSRSASRMRSLSVQEPIRFSAPIAHGRVRYEGWLYIIVPHHSRPFADLAELCLHTADRHGHSRYGTFGRPTWYGALDPATAIAEACHRVLAEPFDGTDEPTPFGLYRAHVRGRFADLYGREQYWPDIIGEDYGATQALACAVRRTMLCGVLYPSARSNGACLAIFARKALRRARFADPVSIRRIDADTVRVRAPWTSTPWIVHRDDLHRTPVRRLACA